MFDKYQSLFEKAKLCDIKQVWSVLSEIKNYFIGQVKKLGPEKGALLEPNKNFVCGNILLALNRGRAFKIVKGNQVEHDGERTKNLTLDMNNLCEDTLFLD